MLFGTPDAPPPKVRWWREWRARRDAFDHSYLDARIGARPIYRGANEDLARRSQDRAAVVDRQVRRHRARQTVPLPSGGGRGAGPQVADAAAALRAATLRAATVSATGAAAGVRVRVPAERVAT